LVRLQLPVLNTLRLLHVDRIESGGIIHLRVFAFALFALAHSARFFRGRCNIFSGLLIFCKHLLSVLDGLLVLILLQKFLLRGHELLSEGFCLFEHQEQAFGQLNFLFGF
jgi:hypothetical protein